MSPVPKRKTSKARRGKRRSHLQIPTPNLVPCSQCHYLKPPHRVCPNCGSYRGRKVLRLKSEKRREQ